LFCVIEETSTLIFDSMPEVFCAVTASAPPACTVWAVVFSMYAWASPLTLLDARLPAEAEPSAPNSALMTKVLIALEACSFPASAVIVARLTPFSVRLPSALTSVSSRYARAASGFSWVR
jgi:hypothetical protein